MQTAKVNPRNIRNRLINELILAEYFLLEAAIESVGAVQEGIQRARLSWAGVLEGPQDTMDNVLRDTASEMIDPFRTRARYFRGIVREDWSEH